MLLFVYGFLRRGQSEHEKLLDKGDPAHYLGPSTSRTSSSSRTGDTHWPTWPETR